MEGCTRIVGHMFFREEESAKPPSPAIGAEQQHINELLGISNEDFLKYRPSAPEGGPQLSSAKLQQNINKLMGIAEEEFSKYYPDTPGAGVNPSSAEMQKVQKHINDMLGIDEQTFLKHSNR